MLESRTGEFMKTVKFDTIEEYEDYLGEIFSYLEQDREYNVFSHCVTNRSRYFLPSEVTPENEIRKKVEGIMKYGLNLDGTQGYGSYGSINGTARFFGSLKKVDVENVSKYDYFSMSNVINTIILILPKYIEINGEKVEFSSYNGRMKYCSQHVKDCLFDIIKTTYLPLEFIFAHQEYNQKTGCVTLNLNEKHLSNLLPDDADEFLEKMAKKCKNKINYCKTKYGAETFEQMFKHMTDEHMIAIDDYLNEP